VHQRKKREKEVEKLRGVGVKSQETEIRIFS